MKEKVFRFIEEFHMIHEGDKVLLGVSGGADSMCLFWLMSECIKSKNADMAVVHVNHGIRGAEADRDEAFVERICKEQQVTFEAVRIDVPGLARKKQISEEECGREERYRIFSEMSEKYACNKIAVAHNKNDVAETVLFNLFRGTGLRGVTGITPVRDNLIRPLLCLERREIEAYMEANGYGYCTDSTNLENDYTRNRIRNDILNYATDNINSETVEHIYSFTKKAAEIENYLASKTEMLYNQVVADKAGRLYLDISALEGIEPIFKKEIIRRCIGCLAGRLKDIEAVHIESILGLVSKQSGRQVSIPYGITAKREYDNIIFFKESLPDKDKNEVIKISFSGKTNEEYVFELPYLSKKLKLHLYNYEKDDIIPQNSFVKWFDFDKLPAEPELRCAEDNDVLQISRNGGTKKIKDYFKDIKISSSERNNYPLLVSQNKVLWVIGKRSGEAFLVDETTKRILIAEII